MDPPSSAVYKVAILVLSTFIACSQLANGKRSVKLVNFSIYSTLADWNPQISLV